QFIYKWFGIASFIFVGLFFVFGYRLLFKVRVYPLNKTFAYSLFFLLFISTTIAYFHGFASNMPHFVEGEFGFWSNRLLQAQIGTAGVGGLLLFSILTFLVIVYNLEFKLPERTVGVGLEDKAEEVELSPKINGNRSDVKREQNIARPAFEIEEKEEVPVFEKPTPVVINEELKPSPTLSVEEVVEEKKADANVLVEKFGQYDP